MFELDDATRRALSQRYGPAPDAQARVLGELRGTLGGPVGPDGGGGEGGPPVGAAPGGGGQVVWIAKICAATVGLTGAGLLVLKLGATVLDVGEERASATPSSTAEVVTPAPVESPVSDTSEPEVEVDTRVPVKSKAAVPVQAPSKIVDAKSTLAAELALLDAAQRLRESDPAAALVRLEQHEKEFPSGVLVPEREALRVEVLRALEGRDSSGRKR
jgi:hypothetical protein